MTAIAKTCITAHSGDILSKNGYGLYINPFRNFGPYRIRFQFDDLSHDPTRAYPDGASKWTRFSYSPNIWDYYYPSNNWRSRFHSGREDSDAIINAPCSILIANLEGVTDISRLFYNQPNSSPTYIHDVYNFYAPDVTDVTELFWECQVLETCDIISLGAPTYGGKIFAQCRSLKKAPYFCTSNMTKATSLFVGCSSLVDIPLYDMSNMTDLSYTFVGCSSLARLPKFRTDSVKCFLSTFSGCTSLQESPDFNTGNAQTLTGMYSNCTSLHRAPALNTGKARSFDYMFSGCTALTYVPLYDTSSMTSDPYGKCDRMFSLCYNVSGGALDLYNQISATGWQPISPERYAEAFVDCGILTESGRRDLEQIPTSWGGLKEE